MEQVKVLLTPIDAEKFLQFQKHYEVFSVLQQQGILDINFGKVVLNFANGVLQSVSKDEVVFKPSNNFPRRLKLFQKQAQDEFDDPLYLIAILSGYNDEKDNDTAEPQYLQNAMAKHIDFREFLGKCVLSYSSSTIAVN